MYYTYIIKSILDNSFYYSSTNNLDGRLKGHNLRGVKYTIGHRP
ncbi:MAG: GIY-YIG nuclease family protein [Ignavibacteriales bacterium]|nr:GIY-YIG nuclease family protein [Ignavibacteriales bacterium]